MSLASDFYLCEHIHHQVKIAVRYLWTSFHSELCFIFTFIKEMRREEGGVFYPQPLYFHMLYLRIKHFDY